MINGFALHDTTTASSGSAEILNGVQQAWGFVPNLHRVLAESPAALEALRQFAAKIIRQRGAVGDADVAAFKAAGYDNHAVLDVLVLAATKLISNYTNHLAETPNDSFMKGAEWIAPGKLKPAA